MSPATKSQIDPLNRKNYGAITTMLTVVDVQKAYEFCQKAFGFEGRGIMPAFGPALRPAEITDMVQMVRFLSREGRNISWWEKYDTLVVAHCNVPWEFVLGYDEPAEKKQP